MKWNEVTWYSKPLTIIFFVIVFPWIAFHIGATYSEVKSNEVSKSLPNEKEEQYEKLVYKDMLEATYKVYINDNGKYGSTREMVFKEMGKSHGIMIERMEGKTFDTTELFWINNYKYDEGGKSVKVYILGEPDGADFLDMRIFELTKVNGKVTANQVGSAL
jgi:hypothetical protein